MREGNQAVHPHAGGEYLHVHSKIRPRYGPSPRGWGIPASCRSEGRRQRSIPTRVGNTAQPEPAPGQPAVHPHAGGEYRPRSGRRNRHSGPSPRGWGIPILPLKSSLSSRSIPTRVGNTLQSCPQLLRSAVHPHAGGEYWESDLSEDVEDGPSPRGWGILDPGQAAQITLRSIPTRVGNTFAGVFLLWHQAVHPHAGGEYNTASSGHRSKSGPSPRGWGILLRCAQQLYLRRSIPTRVGNTACLASAASMSAVHPHAGGEYQFHHGRTGRPRGPSPRGWGIPPRR
ncbi:MAG: hypothetical protein E1N59_2993 [Puniceicoccaceae bacterium 5H]|nr:MAG: hypothetical protein E1N59_2993 [Puniceicoccaceae bacterium 5H]